MFLGTLLWFFCKTNDILRTCKQTRRGKNYNWWRRRENFPDILDVALAPCIDGKSCQNHGAETHLPAQKNFQALFQPSHRILRREKRCSGLWEWCLCSVSCIPLGILRSWTWNQASDLVQSIRPWPDPDSEGPTQPFQLIWQESAEFSKVQQELFASTTFETASMIIFLRRCFFEWAHLYALSSPLPTLHWAHPKVCLSGREANGALAVAHNPKRNCESSPASKAVRRSKLEIASKRKK